MQRAARWRHTIATIAVAGSVALACATDTDTRDASTVPPTSLVPVPATGPPGSTVARAPTIASFQPGEAADGNDVGRLHLAGCAWEWFGRYRLDLEWEPPADGATGSWVAAVSGLSDDVSMFTATGVLVVGGAAGPVSVAVEAPLLRPESPGSTDIVRADSTDVGAGLRCDVTIADRHLGSWPEISFEPAPPDVTWPPDSAQALAIAGAPEMPLVLLASLFEQLPDPPFDRLYVAPGRRLDGAFVSRDGSCLTVTQTYDAGGEPGASVLVEQSRGCPAPSANLGSQTAIPVADPEWFVTVTGDAEPAGAVAAELQRVEVAGAEPVTGSPLPTVEAWFAAYYAERPLVTELTRFAWRDGAVGIVDDGEVGELEQFSAPVVYQPVEPATASRLASICLEQTVGVYREGDGGFAWTVTRDSQRVPTVPLEGGGRAPIPLVPIAGTLLFAGFLDLDPLAWDAAASMDPVDQLGVRLPCTQN